jgi:16S rRNA (guanine966-N2)-methyltransferase
MRITGGQVKGRNLASPKGLNIRPTSDQVREAIFDIIGQDLSSQKVLDLFAGTGSLGLEALSRGAAFALFIDSSQQSINLIKKNLAICGYQHSGDILRRNLRKAIPQNHPQLRSMFDLVFLDPPYSKDFIPLLVEELLAKDLISAGSHVIAESPKTEILPVSFGNLELTDTKVYGGTRISIYEYEANQ